MRGPTAIRRPHQVNVSLSDDEFADLNYLRGDATRTSYIRALIRLAKENPESSPQIHRHTWKKFGKAPVAWDKQAGIPLFKWVCVCSTHKVGPYKESADRS